MMFTLTEILKPLFQIVLFFYGCTIPSNGNILDILTIILDTFPQNSTFGIYKKVFTPIIDPNGVIYRILGQESVKMRKAVQTSKPIQSGMQEIQTPKDNVEVQSQQVTGFR